MRKTMLCLLISASLWSCGCEDAGVAIQTAINIKNIFKQADGNLGQVFSAIGQSQKNTFENQKNNAANAEKIKKLEAEMLLTMAEISFLADKTNQLKAVGNIAEAAKIDADLSTAEKTEFSRAVKLR